MLGIVIVTTYSRWIQGYRTFTWEGNGAAESCILFAAIVISTRNMRFLMAQLSQLKPMEKYHDRIGNSQL